MRLLAAVEHAGRPLRKAAIALPEHFTGSVALRFVDGHLARTRHKLDVEGLCCTQCGQSDLTVVSVTRPVEARDA